MNQKIIKCVGWGGLFLIVLSVSSFFLGKYRTSFYSFEFAVSAFLLFFLLSLFFYYVKSASKFVGFFFLITLCLTSLFCMNFLDGIQKEKKRTYQEWILKAKEKGLVLELPESRQEKTEPSYAPLLVEKHLSDEVQGYRRSEIFPCFSRLSGDYFSQLDFLGVRYVVFHLNKGDEKNSIVVEKIPVAAAFSKELIFKIPVRKPKITVLYGSEFSDDLRLDYGEGAKWFSQGMGRLYLHNHEHQPWNVSLSMKLCSKKPIAVTLKLQDQVVWEEKIEEGEVKIFLPKLSLLSGKNILSFEVKSLNPQSEPIETLLAQQGGIGLGIHNLEVQSLGLSPKEIAQTKEKEWGENKPLAQWLKSLSEKETYLEYPLAWKDWNSPIQYNGGKGNRNFYYDSFISKFASHFLGNEPTPALALWMQFLGIDYLVLHTELYDWPPLLKPEKGFRELKRFGEAYIYRPQTDKIYFEAEQAKRQVGVEVVDPGAREGMARQVLSVDKKGKSAYLVFGPHAPLLPGKYRAVYSLKLERKEKKPIFKIDVSADDGMLVLTEKVLSGDDFPYPKVYRDFALEFELKEVKKVEFRVFHQDPTTGVWADTILLEKI